MASEKRPQLSTQLLLPVLRRRCSGVRETFQVPGNWTGVGLFERLRGSYSESTYGPSASCQVSLSIRLMSIILIYIISHTMPCV